MITETAALVVMLIFSPAHVWEAGPKTAIPGWVSVETCREAAPVLAEKFGVTTSTSSGFLGLSSKEERIPARVECLAFANH